MRKKWRTISNKLSKSKELPRSHNTPADPTLAMVMEELINDIMTMVVEDNSLDDKEGENDDQTERPPN